jgi:cell fate regulator YaaT (PSP1 superfamily)
MIAVKASEYVVTHGRSGFLGRFLAAPGRVFERGDTVAIATSRGLELGTVLGPIASGFGSVVNAVPSGQVVRSATDADLATSATNDSQIPSLIELADSLRQQHDLPIAVLDAEMMLDGQRVVYCVLGGDDDAIGKLAEALSERLNIAIDFYRPDQPADDPGCGKPGCGSGGGGCSSCGGSSGCSTGGCSRGQLATADAVTQYFADLRQRFQQRQGRVSLR